MANTSPRENVELQDLDLDIELGIPQTRKFTLVENPEDAYYESSGSERHDSSAIAKASSVSRVGTKLGGMFQWRDAVGANAERQSQPLTPRNAGNPRSPQETFIKAVIGKDPGSGILLAACKWYTSFLECKTREAWTQLFRPVLVNTNEAAEVPSDTELATAFKFFNTVVLLFKRDGLALVQIVDEAYNKELLTHRNEDAERSIAHQLAFAAVGWISTLYSPNMKPDRDFLQIIDQTHGTTRNHFSNPTGFRRHSGYRSKTFTTDRQPLDSKDSPLYVLLQRFGKVIPEPHAETFGLQDPRNIFPGRNDGRIDPLLVCFHTLNKCTPIKIEWVDCLSLHLEFDSRAKTLKLFRFPSFCLLMYCKQENSPSLVSQIFENSEVLNAETHSPRDLFKEVLLSYRLIFGQTKNSHRDFNKLARKWSKIWNSTPELGKQVDPMLSILCGQHWTSQEAEEIYDEIQAEDASRYYSPISDFPFFGERLVELQSYVRGNNFTALWYDRVDVSWWWTFWAVIIIGGTTLVFALLQTILQIVQVVYSKPR